MQNTKFVLVFALIAVGYISASAQSACTGNAIFTSQQCAGDAVTAAELELYTAVNQYREANGLAPLRLSPPLSRLGNRRMLDLNQNMKTITHSWSNCRYDIKDESTWPCLTAAPTRLNTGYAGEGYETLFRTSKTLAEPSAAVEAWKKSSLHTSIILNKGMFAAMPWEEMGVAIDGSYAVLWFGHRAGRSRSATAAKGDGLSFKAATSGLSSKIRLERVSTVGEKSIWQGETADRKLKLEIRGTESDIENVEIRVSTVPIAGVTVDSHTAAAITALIKNIFPEWTEIDIWLSQSLNLLAQNPKGWRRKILPLRFVEIRGEGADGFRLSIKPLEGPKSIEMD